MTSQKQIEANRRNALSSTGPKTPKGKARVSRNALKHGLLSRARDLLVDGESPKELKDFREAMMAELAPEGELERLLADRVVASAWRLRRANRLERDVIEGDMDRQISRRHRSPDLYGASLYPTASRVAASTICHSDTFGKISRYEAHIERGIYRALHELQRVQAARRGHHVDPPRALDVAVDVSGLPLAAARVDSAEQSHSAADEEGACDGEGEGAEKRGLGSADCAEGRRLGREKTAEPEMNTDLSAKALAKADGRG